jgi:uncharacterized protein involved in exopolysaccharide biosynthesis
VTTPAAASTGADWTDPQMLVLAAIVAACLLGLGSEFLRLRRT